MTTHRLQRYALPIDAKFETAKLPKFQASNINQLHSVTYCAADEGPVRLVIPPKLGSGIHWNSTRYHRQQRSKAAKKTYSKNVRLYAAAGTIVVDSSGFSSSATDTAACFFSTFCFNAAKFLFMAFAMNCLPVISGYFLFGP